MSFKYNVIIHIKNNNVIHIMKRLRSVFKFKVNENTDRFYPYMAGDLKLAAH